MLIKDTDATRERIMQVFRDLVAATVKKGDNVFIYYAGHGWYDDILKSGYWVTTEATKSPSYEEKNLARDRAVNDLSYRLSVSVQSDFKELLGQKGSFSDQQVESSLFVTTRLVLSGVEPQEDWADQRGRLYWIIVTADKEKVDKEVAQQNFVNEVIDRLEGKQDEVLKGIKTIEEVLSHRLTALGGQVAHLTGLVETIDSKIEHAGAQTKQEYASIQTEIKQLEQAFLKGQNATTEELTRQNRVLSDLLRKISQKVGNDYFLSLSADDMKYREENTQFRVHIEPDKGQGADYYHEEKVRFQVRASRECYIKVIYLSTSAEGAGTERRMNILLFPNTHDRNNRIRAGETIVIGRLGELEIQPPYGKDVVTVVASQSQFQDLEETLKQAQGRYYAEVTSNTRGAINIRSRGIGVIETTGSTLESDHVPIPESLLATDTCFIVSHPR
jgi:hypothetical protein